MPIEAMRGVATSLAGSEHVIIWKEGVATCGRASGCTGPGQAGRVAEAELRGHVVVVNLSTLTACANVRPR
jgi:hypothetical protein